MPLFIRDYHHYCHPCLLEPLVLLLQSGIVALQACAQLLPWNSSLLFWILSTTASCLPNFPLFLDYSLIYCNTSSSRFLKKDLQEINFMSPCNLRDGLAGYRNPGLKIISFRIIKYPMLLMRVWSQSDSCCFVSDLISLLAIFRIFLSPVVLLTHNDVQNWCGLFSFIVLGTQWAVSYLFKLEFTCSFVTYIL